MKRHLILAAMFVVTMVAVSCGFQTSTYIPNGSGSEVRAAINNALKSVLSQHSGPIEPDNLQPFMYWVDTSTTPPTTKQRNAGNTAWDVVPTYMQINGTTFQSGSFSIESNTLGGFPKSNFEVGPTQASMQASSVGFLNQISVTNQGLSLSTSGGYISIYSNAAAPATASSTCGLGEIRFDENYMYRCVDWDTWKRIPMSTW